MDLDEFKELVDSYRKSIFNFSSRNWQFHEPLIPQEDGCYITIRIGSAGIYQMLNYFKDGHWQINVLDSSRTIAFDKEKIVL